MGPSWGESFSNTNYFSAFEQQPNVTVASIHAYANIQRMDPTPTPQYFLVAKTSTALPAENAPYVAEAHRHGRLLRIGELNSVDNNGIAGVSNSFSAALPCVRPTRQRGVVDAGN